eukprot:scaffold162515_cov18-Prasinocladus_malaysianus.AAC.1
MVCRHEPSRPIKIGISADKRGTPDYAIVGDKQSSTHQPKYTINKQGPASESLATFLLGLRFLNFTHGIPLLLY